VAGKAFGILLLMSGLGGIGAASTLAEAGQLPIDLGVMRSLVELDSQAPAAASSRRLEHAPAAPATATPDNPADAGPPRSSAVTADGKVILNLATVDDLRNLPGIGPKRAEQIVAMRDKLKRFRRFTDLLRVKGIGPKRLQQLLPKLVLDPPPASDAGAP
jgi:competence protein ComEA